MLPTPPLTLEQCAFGKIIKSESQVDLAQCSFMASCESLFLRLLLSVPSATRLLTALVSWETQTDRHKQASQTRERATASLLQRESPGLSAAPALSLWTRPWSSLCQSLIKHSPGSRKFQLEKVIACFRPPVTAQLYSPRALVSLRPVQKYFWRDLSYFFIMAFKYSCSNLQKMVQSHKCLTVFAIKSTLPPTKLSWKFPSTRVLRVTPASDGQVAVRSERNLVPVDFVTVFSMSLPALRRGISSQCLTLNDAPPPPPK